MRIVGEKELEIQSRIVKLFHKPMEWPYLGNWEVRDNNDNPVLWKRGQNYT